MIRVAAERLERATTSIFVAVGLVPDQAAQVAHSLVEANLMGHESHGVIRVASYVDQVKRGRADPHGQPTVVRQSATTAVMDGGAAFGQIVTRQAMDLAVDKALEHDLGMVAVRHCAHIGRLGEYSVQAAERGCIGMIYASGPGPGGSVTPFLGRSRMLGTNPLSWAFPAKEHPTLFLDYATSVVAWGKLSAAMDKGIPVPEGWLLDKEGQPTTDPHAIMEGGMLLPFAGHKGYALSMAIELLVGGLATGACPAFPDYQWDFPVTVLTINIAAFQPLDEFRHAVDRMIDLAKSARPVDGVDEVLVPGEPEWRARARALREGIALPEATWERLVSVGAEYDLKISND